MLSSTRGLAARLLRPALALDLGRGQVSGTSTWQRRWSTIRIPEEGPDSHDDFKPEFTPPEDALPVTEQIKKDIKENPVMVYMKGVPDAPQCGFSSMVVRILDHYGVEYSARNVLADEELRQGIKKFSQWPTVPQVYVNGEFIGGCDILMNMSKTGELETMLQEVKRAK